MSEPKPQLDSRAVTFITIATAALAMFLRMPSCYESFWLDELHSTWTIWDGFRDVMPRATIGHQSPIYFYGLWIWKQIAGETEVALRFSSVFAVALSCGLLTVGVANWSRSLAAGLAAGLVLACEENSLFFGTELRPYAFVILFASLASVCWLKLLGSKSRHEQQALWSTFIGSALLGVLCQPTSATVFGLMLISLLGVWLMKNPRQSIAVRPIDWLLVLISLSVAMALWSLSLGDAWQARSNWASFASATELLQIWKAFDWTWLLLLPLLLTAIAVAINPNQADKQVTSAVCLLCLLALAVVGIHWLVSFCQWVPVWHRRYFIGVLPILACVSGGAVSCLDRLLGKRGGLCLAVGLALLLAFQQRTLQRLTSYPVALVTRGENWREAMQWIQENADQRHQLILDSGLIEASQWLDDEHSVSPGELQFLRFPIQGPYEADLGSERFQVVDLSSRDLPHPTQQSRLILLTRRPPSRMKNAFPSSQRIYRFGGLSVIESTQDIKKDVNARD